MYIFVCFCCTSVFLLFRFLLIIIDVFPSVLVFNPDLFTLYQFMTFEQRYSTVALIFATFGCLKIDVAWVFKTHLVNHF